MTHARALSKGSTPDPSFIETVRSSTETDASVEWAAMVSGERVSYNDGPPTEAEARKLSKLRRALSDLLTTLPLSGQPENISDYKLLRFLRGYAGNTSEAEQAYREMACFRNERGLDALRDKLVDNGGSSPHLWAEFAPIIKLIAKGVRHQYGVDDYGNILTMTDIGALDLRAIVKNGLEDLYVQFALLAEEHANLTLHEMSTKAGKLVARHDVINVVNFEFFQWNKSCFDLLTPIFEGGKHYPESVRKITSCGNGNVALAAWQLMKHFIPERTKQKLRVLGTSFLPDLLTEIPLACIPLAWGGAGFGSPFDEAWTHRTTEGGAPNTFIIGRRDTLDVKVGMKAGSMVSLSVTLLDYTLGMSIWFAPVGRHSSCSRVAAVGEAQGKRRNDELTKDGDGSTKELTFEMVAPPQMIESSRGEYVVQPWVAPSRGVFKVRFDNTFSMLRGKTVQVHLVVKDGRTPENKEDELEDEHVDDVEF